jgi:hypothetical protein
MQAEKKEKVGYTHHSPKAVHLQKWIKTMGH